MQPKYKILSNGQFGNCLFRLASAMKFYGPENITGIVVYDPQQTQQKLKNTIGQLSRIAPNVKVTDYIIDPFYFLNHTSSYWQSLKCIPSREECRKLFNVPKVADPGKPVVHLRGDDYKTMPGTNMVSKAFLDKAAKCFECDISDFIVCTDDPEFAKSIGIKEEQITHNSPWDDFTLMCSAKKLMISPSTFSWWAGYLGEHERILFPEGFGPWDNGLLSGDPYSANSNREMCWGDECEMINIDDDTAYVMLCTGRYKELFPDFYTTFRENCDSDLFVLTDDLIYFSNYDVKAIEIEHSVWPGVVMKKFANILKYKDQFKKYKNLVVLQANMRFLSKISFNFDEIMFCWHPYNGEHRDYICGGLIGGKTEKYLEMAEITQKWLDEHPDAEWHDETALNWYWKTYKPKCTILPSYIMYAEETPQFKRPGTKIMLLDKVKFFGCNKDRYTAS